MTPALPRTAASGTAAVGAAASGTATARRAATGLGLAGLGLATLAGCAATPATPADTSAVYTDGDYAASGEYQAPSGAETIEVSLTLEDDTVTDVAVVGEATDPTAADFQSRFASGIAAEVVGKDIDEIVVSRVAGSSLTSAGFADALESIRTEARES